MRIEYFQLIDRIESLSLADQKIVASATVPTTNTIFEGHFPGNPLMPGVLLVEAMAQASGWLVIAANKMERMPFLAAIKEAKLRNFVAPGSALRVAANLLHEGSGFAVTRASITLDSQSICDAELTFRILPFPNPEFRTHMLEIAARIEFPTGMLIDA